MLQKEFYTRCGRSHKLNAKCYVVLCFQEYKLSKTLCRWNDKIWSCSPGNFKRPFKAVRKKISRKTKYAEKQSRGALLRPLTAHH